MIKDVILEESLRRADRITNKIFSSIVSLYKDTDKIIVIQDLSNRFDGAVILGIVAAVASVCNTKVVITGKTGRKTTKLLKKIFPNIEYQRKIKNQDYFNSYLITSKNCFSTLVDNCEIFDYDYDGSFFDELNLNDLILIAKEYYNYSEKKIEKELKR